jgi:hypothetical protein
VVRRFEVGARGDEHRVGREEAGQPIAITGIKRGKRFAEPRVRLDLVDAVAELDTLLQVRPGSEAGETSGATKGVGAPENRICGSEEPVLTPRAG